jgi:hypothetical protein
MSAAQTDNAASKYPENAEAAPRKTAMQRLDELKRALQRSLHRKPTLFEKCALDCAALAAMRAEFAAGDPQSKSDDIVRLFNVARRALADFERVAGIDVARKPKRKPTMADIERELRAHG